MNLNNKKSPLTFKAYFSAITFKPVMASKY